MSVVLQDMNLVASGQNPNLTELGHALYAFLHDDRRLERIQPMGWLDGGCLVLARTVLEWARISGEDHARPIAWCTPDWSCPVWMAARGKGEVIGEDFELDGALARRYGITDEEVLVQHFAVELTDFRGRRLFIDGDGLSSVNDFRFKMDYEASATIDRCGPQGAAFGFFHPDAKSLILADLAGQGRSEITARGYEDVIEALAVQLRAEFGDLRGERILAEVFEPQPGRDLSRLRARTTC